MARRVFESSRPATASMASRQASTSSRRRFIRQRRTFSGSLAWPFESSRLLWRYVDDSMISRCSALSDQPDAMNRLRQPVEQLGMARPFAQDAEVAGRRRRARDRSGAARPG